jgi:mono/diheme cytochrome c family protein
MKTLRLGAIAGLLMGSAWALAQSAPTPSPQAQSLEGAALYAQHCAACHQTSGVGTPGLAPAIKGAHWATLGQTPHYLASVVLHGLSGPIVVDGQRFVGVMPGFASSLSDPQLWAVMAHVAQLQGRTAAPQDAAALAQWRSAGGNPSSTRALREKTLR